MVNAMVMVAEVTGMVETARAPQGDQEFMQSCNFFLTKLNHACSS
uniref:Uncharacterized protein n=1 Tax=Rhizophora mucronata TaxID=61149 RepID=A0A2P2NBY1_RHIMU